MCRSSKATSQRRFENSSVKIDHFQIAGVPERHEPDIGEMNYPYLFDLIDELGFEGWVGCEYDPRQPARTGFG